ncbi:PrsW family intramembrane metalloprotease [Leucobacter aridicollis]|uniref:PrsW family intramembrane metalloprotease n=1 Tax=Leucobacter aridicollis TaxID=283878 RepID=UPI0021020BC0|nr:PrsW family intramembrane metalloprotease [Leucobacter aridicollis]UTX52484.1 PrsW family intramembrane metalloprotease [Leucobacter aridicollis]
MNLQTPGTSTDTLPRDALDIQAAAISRSGWGATFEFVQPRNLCFWLYLILTGVGAVNLWKYVAPKAGFFAESLTLGAVVVGLAGIAWALWFHHIDRWERQPLGVVATALVWGAVPASFGFALTANSALLSIYPKLFGQEWAASWAAGLIAPFTEETAKLCGFLLIMGLAPKLVRTANDGLLIGAFIGLGFAVFEDFLYAVNATFDAFGVNPDASVVNVSVLRIATSAVSHPLFSALVCSGVIYLIGTVAQPRRVVRGVVFVLAGMALHFVWDDAAGLAGGNGLSMLLVLFGATVVALIVLSIAFRLALPVEAQVLRDILAPEVESGVVTAPEVASVADRRARRRFIRSAHGHAQRRAHRHLRHAVLGLAHELASAHGAHTDSVERARAEVVRLREAAGSELPSAGAE